MVLRHYTHLTFSDACKAIEILPDFNRLGSETGANRKTGTNDTDAFDEVPRGAEIGAVRQAFCGKFCQFSAAKAKSKKNAGLGKNDVSVGIGSICHRNAQCPGLESNQHDPKVTSPSS